MTPTLQSARDLRLNLIEGPLNAWSQFNIIESAEKTMGPWNVTARVIGASHLISIRCESLCLHEIFACMKVKTDADRIFCHPVADDGILEHPFTGRIQYTFKPRSLAWSDGESLMSDLDRSVNANSGSNIGLSVDFSPMEGGIVPKTIVLIDSPDKGLRFRTIHSYPNEAIIVYTESMIGPMAGPPNAEPVAGVPEAVANKPAHGK